MKSIFELRKMYEKNRKKLTSELLHFAGVGNRDVYNCSVPFKQNGKTYILGRVEKREEWANSVSYLFEQGADGVWYKVSEFDALPIEDPFYTEINGECVVIGTHVVKEEGKVKTYFAYFYRGTDIFNLKYFTTGPEYMKDIRLVQMPKGKIGLFSRPRNNEMKVRYACESMVGFTVVSSLDDIKAKLIKEAPYVKNFFEEGEWGGVNQAFWLGKGLIGAIGHQCYSYYDEEGTKISVYMNTAYVLDILSNKVIDKQIIALRDDYPDTESKTEELVDCAFTSGIVGLENDKVELYSGLSDLAEGKVIIENPFLKYIYIKTN